MEKFTTHTGIAAPLKRSAVDTDQIIPAVFLKRVTKTGFDDALFANWRQDPEFILNQDAYRSASVLVAGPDFGTGSSRDWAAKGTRLLGVDAVIAESFERIQRTNLVGFGVLPLQFMDGENVASLGLTGEETFSFTRPPGPGDDTVDVVAQPPQGEEVRFRTRLRIDTATEWEYYRHGGILHAVIRKLALQ